MCFNYVDDLPFRGILAGGLAGQTAAAVRSSHACLELKSDGKKGLQSGRVVIQAERASLTLPPVGNSDTSPASSVCANSRTQTQAAQPSVSAKSLRFRERAIHR